jgi:hypothetical protein
MTWVLGTDGSYLYSGYIQTHCQKNKKIKRADQILPEVYGTTLREVVLLIEDTYSLLKVFTL